jgi:hypothetical protein
VRTGKIISDEYTTSTTSSKTLDVSDTPPLSQTFTFKPFTVLRSYIFIFYTRKYIATSSENPADYRVCHIPVDSFFPEKTSDELCQVIVCLRVSWKRILQIFIGFFNVLFFLLA